MDGTQRRQEATDDEDEDEDEEAEEQGGWAQASGADATAVSSTPAVATSPRSSLAEPPGFSPVREASGEALVPGLRVRPQRLGCP